MKLHITPLVCRSALKECQTDLQLQLRFLLVQGRLDQETNCANSIAIRKYYQLLSTAIVPGRVIVTGETTQPFIMTVESPSADLKNNFGSLVLINHSS